LPWVIIGKRKTSHLVGNKPLPSAVGKNTSFTGGNCGNLASKDGESGIASRKGLVGDVTLNRRGWTCLQAIN